MPCTFQQWLRLTPETTFGVYASGNTPIWIRLEGDNAFKMSVIPQRQSRNSADAGNRRRSNISARYLVDGTLTTPFYPEQADALLSWAAELTSNQTSSMTADFFDSVRTRRYLGTKVKQYQLTSDSSSDELIQQLQLWALKPDGTDPTLAQPADTVFPSSLPYLHTESAGLVKKDGAAITRYSSFTFTINNTLARQHDELPQVSQIDYCGRLVDMTLRKQYVDSTYRTLYEAQTPVALEAKWLRASPSSSVLIDFASTCIISDLGDDLPLGGIGNSEVTFECHYTRTDSTDLTITVV